MQSHLPFALCLETIHQFIIPQEDVLWKPFLVLLNKELFFMAAFVEICLSEYSPKTRLKQIIQIPNKFFRSPH